MIAAAIDKYVYVSVMRPFSPGIYLKYSSLEHVDRVPDVKHRIIREALEMQKLDNPQIEISTLADIPAGTGLGSSGSFTTALLKALYTHQRKIAHAQELAELACEIEINRLGDPVGKQDQFIAAFGGITCMTFHKNHRVTLQPLRLSSKTMFDLEDNLLLFFTGFNRAAASILKDQNVRSMTGDADMLRNLDYVKALGYRSQEALESGHLERFGALMDEHWQHKKRRSGGISNPQIDKWYSHAMRNGAVGGKLVGAGGGGFLLVFTPRPEDVRQAMAAAGAFELPFDFESQGCSGT
ncbi:MAG: galactokinase, partial [Steroidobacteraceae bacterium]